MSLPLKLEKTLNKFMFGEMHMSAIHQVCIDPTFKSGRTSLMIWDAFAGGKKSQLVFMPKDRRSAKDFVEVVYNVELLHFMSRVP